MRRLEAATLAVLALMLVSAVSGRVFSGNLTYGDTFFDDLSVGSERAQTGAGTPTYGPVAGGGYGYFLANGDGLRFSLQTSHRMVLNSSLSVHVHVAPDGTDADGGNVRFALDCDYADVGEAFTALPTITSADCAVGTVTDKHVRCDVGALTGNAGMSAVAICSIARTAASTDDYTGEVAVVFTDAHFEIDQPGSRQETSK